MPLYLHYYVLYFQGLLFHLAAAQSVESFWTVPDGNVNPSTQIFYEGDTFPIAWEGWNSSYIGYFLAGVSVADLWITSFDYNTAPFAQVITGRLRERLMPPLWSL
jgi:hypothetical protein